MATVESTGVIEYISEGLVASGLMIECYWDLGHVGEALLPTRERVEMASLDALTTYRSERQKDVATTKAKERDAGELLHNGD